MVVTEEDGTHGTQVIHAIEGIEGIEDIDEDHIIGGHITNGLWI